MAGPNYGGEALPPATQPESAPNVEIAPKKRRVRKAATEKPLVKPPIEEDAPTDILGFNGDRILLARMAAHQCHMLCSALLSTLEENLHEDMFVDRAIASRAVMLANAATVLLCAPKSEVEAEMEEWDLLVNAGRVKA